MNKLVIIGNGFDLAHNLPTFYTHFINYFWESLLENYEDETVKQMIYINPGYFDFFKNNNKVIKSYKDFAETMKSNVQYFGFKLTDRYDEITVKHSNNTQIFHFKNSFFRLITIESIKNWVDIENIYYEILKDLVKKNSAKKYQYPHGITKLNSEFDLIKILLEKYLKRQVSDKFDFKNEPTNNHEVLDLFKIRPRHLASNEDHDAFNEFPPEDRNHLIEFDSKLIKINESKQFIKAVGDNMEWPKSLFLDFNYTKTSENYVKQINSRNIKDYGEAILIRIHGELESEKNKINFGFGDEMDDDYKIIEKTGKNEYLTNIKSFQYLHNSNYRKLLNWVETNKFQVYIFGHSCGLSDRTLLNTIFENNNCRSIKIFYHQKESQDNYTELTHNLSRHFNKKALMRSKIVDKTLCKELSQNIRFKEIKKTI